jgi:MoaA/NifB/PqqE/SkfB family radical SAM enzyme
MLKCPRCPRTELNIDHVNQEITLDDFKSGFPPDVLSQIELFIFCGSIGDPIYSTEFLEIVEYIKQNSRVRVRIVTNGSYKKPEWWQRLGSILDHYDMITFSVDGWDNDSNNQYRVNSNFDSILVGLRTLRQISNCHIRWSTIYFSFNQQHIDDIRQVAKVNGCDSFQTVKSSKFDGRYLTGQVDIMKPADELVASTLIYEPEIEFLQVSKYVPLLPAKPTTPHAWAKCLNHKKDMFVGIDGLVVPCPWFDNTYQQNSFIQEHQDRLSIRRRSFFEIINDTDLWNKLIDSFDNDPLPICKLKCKNDQS